MIRIRRVTPRRPWVRVYELELLEHDFRAHVRLRRSNAFRRLEATLGTGDAWSFMLEADRQWRAGHRDGWAVEFNRAG